MDNGHGTHGNSPIFRVTWTAHRAGIQAMGLVPTLTAKLSRLKTKAQEAAMKARASRERADKERLEAETAIAR